MTYKDSSDWNDLNELKCLVILKVLKLENYPRNRQMELCEELARKSKLTKGSISAKVSNFKSLDGINKKSNASKNSKMIYDSYNKFNIEELKNIIIELN